MTEEDKKEFRYRYDERLGILTDGRDPTKEQIALAFKCAKECMRRINEAEKDDTKSK